MSTGALRRSIGRSGGIWPLAKDAETKPGAPTANRLAIDGKSRNAFPGTFSGTRYRGFVRQMVIPKSLDGMIRARVGFIAASHAIPHDGCWTSWERLIVQGKLLSPAGL